VAVEKEVELAIGKKLTDELTSDEMDRVAAITWDVKRRFERELAKRKATGKLDFKEQMRAVFASIHEKRESPIEERLLLALNGRSICSGRVKSQMEIGPYRIDLAFPEVKLAIECDGKEFHTDPVDRARDQKRDEYLRGLGWTVLRLTGAEIHREISRCIERVTWTYERLADKRGIAEAWE
jgi:very-short-patch-repair endonuclease